VTLTLNLPSGWTATNTTPNSFGRGTARAARSPHVDRHGAGGQQPGAQVVGVTETVGGVQSGVSSAVTQVPYATLADGFQQRVDHRRHQPGPGNIDGGGNSFSAQAFAAVGLTPGATLTHNG